MAFITWRPELEVGISAIDGQHQREIDLINDLHDAITNRRGDDVIGVVLKELLDHTVFHFCFEEAVMRTHGFPGLEAHQREHVAVTDQLSAVATTGGTGETLALIYTLSRWLKGHIVAVDMKYSPYLKARNVA